MRLVVVTLLAMRAFLRLSSGSVEQPAGGISSSSVEQPAESFSSIDALDRWLHSQGDALSSPELQKLRAAVAALSQKPSPTPRSIVPLCSAWNVRRKESGKHRALDNMIADLQRAVRAEGKRLSRLPARGLLAQTEGNASSASTTAGQSTVRRLVDSEPQ